MCFKSFENRVPRKILGPKKEVIGRRLKKTVKRRA